MDPAARIELLSQVNSTRFVDASNENERCVQLADDDKKNEKIERIGGEQQQGVQRLYVGYTCYRVVVMGPGAYLPYAPPVVVRTSVIIVRGTRRHYVGLAPSWWIWTGRSYGYYGFYGGYGYGYYGGGGWGTRTYHSHHHHHSYHSGTHYGGFGRSHHSGISS